MTERAEKMADNMGFIAQARNVTSRRPAPTRSQSLTLRMVMTKF